MGPKGGSVIGRVRLREGKGMLGGYKGEERYGGTEGEQKRKRAREGDGRLEGD